MYRTGRPGPGEDLPTPRPLTAVVGDHLVFPAIGRSFDRIAEGSGISVVQQQSDLLQRILLRQSHDPFGGRQAPSPATCPVITGGLSVEQILGVAGRPVNR